jgi:hypothetical protein
MRSETEKNVVTKIVQEALDRGLQISVTSLRGKSEVQILEKETNFCSIIESLDSGGDMDRLNLFTSQGFEHGWLYLQYGAGRDLIVDYTEGNLDCSQLAHLAQSADWG